MAESTQDIRSLFKNAEDGRRSLDSSFDTNSSSYQDNVVATIATFEECRILASRLSLFSPNETVDDISSGSLPYLLIDFHIAELTLRHNLSHRERILHRAREAFERYLERLESYSLLSWDERKLFEQYTEDPDAFSTASKRDAAIRRDTKIARFREEKELKKKLEYLSQNPSALANDDAALRELHFTTIKLSTHQTFASLESIAQELQILSLAPPTPPISLDAVSRDHRERDGSAASNYSERLDAPLSQLMANGKAGPILDSSGKPLKPFTLLDSRDRLRQGVFKSGHNLPTMTIDEYLEEEKKRGGIIEGGGQQSGMKPEVDEDDFDKADEETMKAREWDEFTESNPK
ncbi:MAG: hypothetical protein M1837_003195 [Sclerophora amabilis]|nr:MAG: hypothetical protein M1837_003195 [Sclerophora amabilis]